MFLLLVNDHWLKGVGPAWLTGKLSDIAGLVLLPLVLQATWEVGQTLRRRFEAPSDRVLLAAVGLSGVGFALVQLVPTVNVAFEWGLGSLQWPFYSVRAWVAGQPCPPLRPVQSWADPSDLLALPALSLAWWIGRCPGS